MRSSTTCDVEEGWSSVVSSINLQINEVEGGSCVAVVQTEVLAFVEAIAELDEAV